MTNNDQLEQAYVAGWNRGVTDYAIWKDGDQLVGYQPQLLKDVLAKGPDNDLMRMDLPSSEDVFQDHLSDD